MILCRNGAALALQARRLRASDGDSA